MRLPINSAVIIECKKISATLRTSCRCDTLFCVLTYMTYDSLLLPNPKGVKSFSLMDLFCEMLEKDLISPFADAAKSEKSIAHCMLH